MSGPAATIGRAGGGVRSPDPVPHAERGAVLGAGLVLLLLLTLLGLAGMTAATAGLMMAGNDQRRAQAFDAAEAGITRALRTAVPPVAGALDGPAAAFDAELLPQARLAVRLTPLPCAAPCLPPAGFSLDAGGETLLARYFTITSTGTVLGARAVHEQVAYVLTSAE